MKRIEKQKDEEMDEEVQIIRSRAMPEQGFGADWGVDGKISMYVGRSTSRSNAMNGSFCVVSTKTRSTLQTMLQLVNSARALSRFKGAMPCRTFGGGGGGL